MPRSSASASTRWGWRSNSVGCLTCGRPSTGHVPSREYLPRGYGQLGCSGFVVADGEGNFLSRKTRAYLQYGDVAFAHVEELLAGQGVSKAAGIKSPKSKASNKEVAVDAVDLDEKKEDVPVEKVPSVGVDSMDDEHECCEAALALLRQTKVKALEALMGELIGKGAGSSNG